MKKATYINVCGLGSTVSPVPPVVRVLTASPPEAPTPFDAPIAGGGAALVNPKEVIILRMLANKELSTRNSGEI